MAIIGFQHNFLEGLSDFWQRFFADSEQLNTLYQGTAKLIGQAYLDLISNVLGVSLKDVPAFNKEYFRLLTLREDELRFERGTAIDDDRWVYSLPDDLVSFVSLDNRVIEPTAALQEDSDYDLADGELRFKVDPTDPEGSGLPLSGYARRALDIIVGGEFDDSTRTFTQSWLSRNVRKGDTLRLLDLSEDASQQTRQSDHVIAVVRAESFFVSADAPLTETADPVPYVILRTPADAAVQYEAFTAPGFSAIPLTHTRLDAGSVRVFARAPGGGDVVEGVDYTVDYEHGRLYRLTAWGAAPNYSVNYTWKQEVWPSSGTSPRLSQTGVIREGEGATTRVLQMALWATDTLVDRRVLANNFGALLGIEEASSEAYRAFLRGIFQLYVLGPVLERIESALNVIVGLPVIRDDGELYVSIVTGETTKTVTTQRLNGALATYEFPLEAPMRTDLVEGLELNSFEPLTTAITVTDYIQDPTWWHHITIPRALFDEPSASRRTVSPLYIKHVIGAPDFPKIGDPGFVIGATEEGFVPPEGQPVLRHRLSFVLMDRYLKFHTFIIRFNPAVLSGLGVQFTHTLTELTDLVFSAKPAHSFLLVQPALEFVDTAIIDDGDSAPYYQPQRYLGADADSTELFETEEEVDTDQPYTQLGLVIDPSFGTPPNQPDQVLFTDASFALDGGIWLIGDYFHYELFDQALNFPTTAAVALGHAPIAPRRGRLVQVYIDTTKSGKRLVENVDYTVNYVARTVARITAWDDLTAVAVSYVQLNIGNEGDAVPDPLVGDTNLMISGQDPALITGSFDPTATDWLDEAQPIDNHRDIGLVDRVLTITITPA